MSVGVFIQIAVFVAVILVSEADSAAAGQPAAQPAVKVESLVSPRPGTEAMPRLLETFRVGKNVYVRSLAIDRQRHSLWVGTSLGAHEVDLATRELKHTFTRRDGLANEYVFALLVDQQGNKWFGTNGGGMSRYRDGHWKTFFPMHGLADYWVYAFAEQQDGTLWIGTWAGVNRLDRTTGKLTTYVDELVNEWVYGVGVDRRNRVWFGTEGGVSMYDGRHWQSWTHKDGLGAPNRDGLPLSTNTGLGTRARHNLSVLSAGRPTYNPNYVFCILIDRDDSVWAGTWGGGVSHFDGRQWRNLTTADGLAGDIVYSMAQDNDGVLWLGTNRGLSRYDGKNWRRYGRADGLDDDNVYAVTVAPNGDVWIGTRGTVARIGYGKNSAKAGVEQ